MTGDGFRLTYSTMFDPPAALHERFEAALAQVKSRLGRDYPMWIGGRERLAEATFEGRSPIDQSWLLGRFARGGPAEAKEAIAAARAAFPAWAATP
jgi:1-pyrroline-5-carboxylate dehydrogenase